MTTFPDLFRSDFDISSSEIPSDAPFKGDFLWRDHAGDNAIWIMNNNTPSAVAALAFVTPDWHVKATADFDGTGGNRDADILWQNDNGALALWQMRGTTALTKSALPNPGPTWHVVGDNDFNGDTADDILFQNDNGATVIWTISSSFMPTITGAFTGLQNPGPTWHVVGTGDTTNDGKAGILWQNDNGALALWENPTLGAGIFTFTTVAPLPAVDPSWHVKGMADVGGFDGRADIVFQHDSGAVAVWEMGGAAGTTILDVSLVNLNPGPAWHVVGLRDMNGDSQADILFQNDDGAAAVWEGYHLLGGGSATFNQVLSIIPNPNPNGHVWDLL